ncbi:hypothetical protein [Acetivibrio cellulolyticus]|uniref:hypothetical protein n=1 Tax=Acetivibrio cellulolyticus TaxID=35830 RepID=UPI0001E2E374|nr:hypothetical protein [Acetivibrio cellulolyticus]
MIIDASTTIAYKCSSCGTFEFVNITLFELSFGREAAFNCRCNGSMLVISKENTDSYKIAIPCIGCGTSHVYILERKDFIKPDVSIFYCPKTGIQQCFIGSDKDVRKRIDNLEKEFDELINMLGYDSYFTNTQVMFDSLNLIHDIAEKGNLFCECGNDDIELLLLSDKIYLRCKKCPASKILYASTNEHLRENLKVKQILLLDEGLGLGNLPFESLIRKK